ncbi:RNA polymerase sigma factor [Ideonella sp.]|uniref:RNA polymerase sigma factor n=1 Tax=Ideonella sp. TaxID=1929293 RepID=UPI0035B49D3E
MDDAPLPPGPEPNDADLVRACQRGSPAAWRTLVQRYQRLIYTVPRRAGLDEHEAADVFQVAFTALWQQLPRLQQPERVQAWLVTTARRETLRRLRQRQREAPLAAAVGGPTEDETGNPADAEPVDHDALLPAEQLQALQAQQQVQRAMARLDARSRELLSYLYLSDPPLSYEEVAGRMGMALGSVGPTRARCLDKLRQALQALA